MQSFVLMVAVLALAVVASVQAKCAGGCTVPVPHYEETGCTPVFAKPEDCCPSHYNCAKFEGRSADKCYVKGTVYNKGDQIDGSLTERHCLAACSCTLRNNWEDITCAHIDCPEFLGANRLDPGCYRAYKLDGCCSTKSVCPPFDNLAKCEVGGKTYYEGQSWYTENDEKKCVCKPNFAGKLEEPFCRDVTCGIEFLSPQKLKGKCAPVFYGSKGCPIQWECQGEGQVVVPNKEGTTSEQKCSFGDKKLNIGDKLILNQSSSSPKIDCDCKIPPLLTCIQRPYDS